MLPASPGHSNDIVMGGYLKTLVILPFESCSKVFVLSPHETLA